MVHSTVPGVPLAEPLSINPVGLDGELDTTMLDDTGFHKWCADQALPEQTVEEIARIRESDPSRRVASTGINVPGTFPSKKMGHLVGSESHKGELPNMYLFEKDEDVLEYWEQPPPIKISFTRKDGKPTAVFHTPDFFLIREKEAGWEEIKDEKELDERAKKYPNRYIRSTTGEWHDLAGEDYANRLGLYYRVRSSSEINWVLQRNLQYIYNYFALPLENPDQVSLIKGLVYAENGIKLTDLIDAIKPCPPDIIYMMILNEMIYVDIQKQSLPEPSTVSVFSDEKACSQASIKNSQPIEIKRNSVVLWAGREYKVINILPEDVYLEDLQEGGSVVAIKSENLLKLLKEHKLYIYSSPEINSALKIIKNASPAEIEAANSKYSKVLPILNGDRTGNINRSTYRHINNFMEEQEAHGNGYIGLIDQRHKKGNRTIRLLPEVLKIIDEVLEEELLSTVKRVPAGIYNEICLRLESKKLPIPSKTTFYKRINQIPKLVSTQEREGGKASYKFEPEFLELEYTTPPHGDYPFQIAHVDHTLLDMEFIATDTGVVIERLWLTLLIDAYSRRILGFYLSYDAPSYRSIMMVARDCVRRFGRFPDFIVHDGGKEFESIYFNSLIAWFKSGTKLRPSKKGRYGNILEKLFGTVNTKILYNLSGNTQSTKVVRQLTKEVDPKKNAAWSLDKFYDRFEEWAFNIYDNRKHEALGQSPRAAFEYRQSVSGYRLNRIVVYDEQFIRLTCPAPPKKTSTIIPGKGVKINGIYYTCEAFRSGRVERKSFPTRYDPENMGRAYVYIGGKWEECRSRNYALLCDKSEKYLTIAAILYRKYAAVRGENNRFSVEEAVFTMSLRNEDKLLVQQRKDAEMAPKEKNVTPEPTQDDNLWKPRSHYDTLEEF